MYTYTQPIGIQGGSSMYTWQERLMANCDFLPWCGCWLWRAKLDKDGYGMIGRQRAYRASYEVFIGPIRPGYEIAHKRNCISKACINPDHLMQLTHMEHTRYDAPTHCPKGHPYSGSNLYTRPNGHRDCKACRRVSDQKRKR